MIIGLDEAGRGALAGPVVAGAVLEITNDELRMTSDGVFDLIKDSKKLTDSQRRQAYDWLLKHVRYGVGVVSAKEIDELGIKPATEKAMNLALSELLSKNPLPAPPSGRGDKGVKLLVDGRDGFSFPYLSEDIVKGDEKILEISAASIIAKVTRDDYMIKLDTQYPQFGFAGHKGYGAAHHYQLLDQGQYCPEHRTTYDPLKTWLNQGRLF